MHFVGVIAKRAEYHGVGETQALPIDTRATYTAIHIRHTLCACPSIGEHATLSVEANILARQLSAQTGILQQTRIALFCVLT